MTKFNLKYILILAFLIAGGFGLIRNVSASCGNHNVYGWGWNPYIGWISLNCNQSYGTGVTSDIDYGVNIDTSYNVSGYAWSGWGDGYWICFGNTCEGDDPNVPPNPMEARYDTGENKIVGWAKFMSWGDDGWIKLSKDEEDLGEVNYSMNIDFLNTASGYYYLIKSCFLSSCGNPFINAGGGYSWNNKIGWIRWYSVCKDEDGDGYGQAMDGWGINDDDICGNDCVDSESDCGIYEDMYPESEIPNGSWYQENGWTIDLGETLGTLVARRCRDIMSGIYPGSTEICNDLIDNNCKGLIDCADPSCAYSPTGPSGLNGDGDTCGEIRLEWQPGVGEGSNAHCREAFGEEDGDEFIIYRSLKSNGCDCDGDDGCVPEGDLGCTEIGSVNTAEDIKSASECLSDNECYQYKDLNVIPRVGYYYWITRETTQIFECDDEDEGCEPSEIITETSATEGGPYETVCYPGQDWREN